MQDATHPAPQVTDELVAAVARDADVDPRTVVRSLAGLPVRGRVGVRIVRALAARGVHVRRAEQHIHA